MKGLAGFCTLVFVLAVSFMLISVDGGNASLALCLAILSGSALIGRCILECGLHFRTPEETGTPCPYCGKALRTPNAKQCFSCGEDWHDPVAPRRAGEKLRT